MGLDESGQEVVLDDGGGAWQSRPSMAGQGMKQGSGSRDLAHGGVA